VLDGEIVCLDKRGRPQFNDLLFHRGEPCFFAFDLLMSDGKDLRTERLTDRRHELRRLLSRAPISGIAIFAPLELKFTIVVGLPIQPFATYLSRQTHHPEGDRIHPTVGEGCAS
jgi:hypothetical protein